jgi:2-dehydropantoate 2-reductase
VQRFVVHGAGAIGGVIGARLHEHGHDVVLVARGPHLDAIRSRGLTIESPDRSATLAVPAVASPAEIDFTPDDVVLVAVKSQDTVAALDALRSATDHALPIVCLQNGVANERFALRRFADVYGVCVMCPAAHVEPGVVQASSSPIAGLLDIGRYPSGTDDTARAVAAAFSASTFESVPRDDVMRWKYTKLLMNLGNAVEALCAPSPAAGALAARLRAEGVACLEAAGIAFASEAEDRDRRADKLSIRPIGGARRGGGSSWQSLARGAGSIESDYLNGEIVLVGRTHGVPTPANALVQRLANRAAREGRAPGSMPAADVLAMLD